MSEPGFVYILTNPSFREDWVKIGKSSRPVDVRSKELDNTAVPLPFEIYATMKTAKYNEAEKLIHRYIERFTNLRIRDNREFFNISPEVALDIFRDVAGVLGDAEIVETHKQNMFGEEQVSVNEEPTIYHKRSIYNPTRSHERSYGKHVTPPRSEKKVWLLASNRKFFDLKGCFNKFGEVYWTQFYNMQVGDTGYIYSASPESAIRYKFVVEGQDLPYNPEMERELAFYVTPKDAEPSRKHNRFALLKLTGETHSNHLRLANLLDNGLRSAPMGVVTLSKKEYQELLEYINSNF